MRSTILLISCILLALLLPGGAQSLDEHVSLPPKNTPAPEFNLSGSPAVNPDVAATVVVYNEKEPDSANLARTYALKRGIAADHLVALSCTTGEIISRAEYDQQIAEPLRKEFVKRGWWRLRTGSHGIAVTASSIRFVALIRGIPLKIAPVASYSGDDPESVDIPLLREHNEAAVDSELATLGYYSRQVSGMLKNPFYRSFAPLADEPTPALLLVCRLDAAYPLTVLSMIDNSLLAEKTGLWGFAYVDARGLPAGDKLREGDRWMERVRLDTLKHGIPTVFDDLPGQFPFHYPMRFAALYFGWYSEQVEGAIADDHIRFLPGAVAVHIHSFSAASLRKPTRNWCAPLLEKGVCATLGNVYEPYLVFTPNLDIFEERLRSGMTFAESAYASIPVLSWMTTFIGDPLYRPFKIQQDITADLSSGTTAEWVAYREGVRVWFSKNRAAGEAVLLAKAKELNSGAILEGLGCLQEWAKDPEAAVRSWASASRLYPNEEDQVRCVLHAVALRRAAGETQKALGLAQQQVRAHPRATATQVLRAIETELAATPTPAAKPTR